MMGVSCKAIKISHNLVLIPHCVVYSLIHNDASMVFDRVIGYITTNNWVTTVF